MAIAQAGSTLQFGVNNTANTGTVSSAITVPADAELVLCHVSAFQGSVSGLSGGAMTFTKGGAATAMTVYGGGNSDSSTGFWQGAGFYLVLPDTGSSKSLAWDWAGTGASGDGIMNFALTFWKGVDTSSPVRGSGGAANSNSFPRTTGTLTALTGDKIVTHLAGFVGAGDGSGAVSAWSNATSLSEPANFGYAELSIATSDPTGNQTVGTSTVAGYSEGGLSSVVLKAAAAAASSLLWTPSRSFTHMLIR